MEEAGVKVLSRTFSRHPQGAVEVDVRGAVQTMLVADIQEAAKLNEGTDLGVVYRGVLRHAEAANYS